MASDEEIKTLAVKIALDASSFTQQAAAFKKQVTALDSGFKASVAGIKDWGTQSTHLKDQVKALGSQIDVEKQVVSSYQSQITKTSAALEAHSKQLVTNRDNVAKLKTAYDQSASTLGKNADETKALKKQLDDAEQALSKSESQVRRNQSAIDGYNIQLNNATAKLNTMEAALKNANSALFDHTNALAKAGTALQSAGDKITSAGSKITGIGTTLTAGVTAPIVGIGVAAETTGMNFEAQMSRVQAIAGATGDQLKDLTQTAMDLGAKTTYSDQEVAQGMENMASAGFSVNEITAAMPGMLNLAASSGEDLASSADIAASTLRGFGLAADQAGHVADVLAKNAANTNAAVADTGLAMKYIAPLAQNAGWSLEQVTAAIGEMADKGIKGEQAGTSLRGTLTNLISPSDKQAAAMKEVGLQVYNASGKMNSLSNIIGQLQKGTAKMTNAQRDQAIATIVGTDALSGMQALISDGSSALDTMTQSLKDSDGAAQDMANTMLNNTKGSIEQMKGSVENAGIALSKVLSPTVRDAADKATDLANKFANSSDATKKQTVQYALLAAAAGPVLLGTGKVVESIGSSVKVFGKGVSGVANFVKGLAGIAPAAGEAIPMMTKFGLALATNPALAFATAIGLASAAIAGFIFMIKNVKTPTDDLVNSLKEEEKTWKDVKKAADDNAESQLADVNNTQSLWNQLNDLVDKNGKVIGNNRDKVQELIGLINGAAGQTMLTMIDGQIIKWGEAKEAVDKYIASQKAQIMLDAHKDEYEQALKDYQGDLTNIYSLKNKISQQQQEIDKYEQTPNYSLIRLESMKSNLNNAKNTLSTYQNDVKQKLNTISDYQDAMAAETNQDYDKVNQILGASVLKYTDTTTATAAQLGQQVLNTKSNLDYLLNLQQTGQAKVTDAEIQALQQRNQEAQNLYDKAMGQAGASAILIGNSYSNGLSSTAGSAASAGSQVGQAAANGMLSANYYGVGAAAANSFDSAFQSFNARVAGETIGQQVIDGINSKLRRVELTGGITGYKSSGGGMTITPYATGTDYFRGGLAYINEKGGEIVNLPTGSQIIPHDISMAIAQAVGQAAGSGNRTPQFNITINAYGADAAKQQDMAAISARVFQEGYKRYARARG